MMIISFLFIFTGFIALSLSMKRHFKQCSPQRRMPSLKLLFVFRLAGYISLIISMSLCMIAQDLGLGLVLWFGLLTIAALLQLLLLTYKPQWVIPIGFINLICTISYTSITLQS